MKTTMKSLTKQLGTFIKVENMVSVKNTVNRVANQFLVIYKNGCIFRSYEANIAVKIGTKLYLDPRHSYSYTTNAYCKAFCGMGKQERLNAIAEGKSQYYSIVEEINLN